MCSEMAERLLRVSRGSGAGLVGLGSMALDALVAPAKPRRLSIHACRLERHRDEIRPGLPDGQPRSDIRSRCLANVSLTEA